ncbi:hypothetical protein [Devosia sp. CN2-171]|uniref:hypothetical protein n=1 Tax=Devosia sp. CN2-171 TaxID=3400909 RepID=UPI003BF77D74
MTRSAGGFHSELLASVLKEAEEAGRIIVEPSTAEFFDRLTGGFPTSSSKIDWSKVPGAIGRLGPVTSGDVHISFVSAIRRRHHLVGPVAYAGDALTEMTIRGELDELIPLLPSLLEVPQHHYLAAASGAWCFCFSFEGNSDFGFAPSRPDLQTGT